jgi:hypothetical protein
MRDGTSAVNPISNFLFRREGRKTLYIILFFPAAAAIAAPNSGLCPVIFKIAKQHAAQQWRSGPGFVDQIVTFLIGRCDNNIGRNISNLRI